LNPAVLALEDGTVFEGSSFGAPVERTGEVVFNTAITGYQEVFTDPSYSGQIVVLTYPQIGNYGVAPDDVESSTPKVAGFIMRDCHLPAYRQAGFNPVAIASRKRASAARTG